MEEYLDPYRSETPVPSFRRDFVESRGDVPVTGTGVNKVK